MSEATTVRVVEEEVELSLWITTPANGATVPAQSLPTSITVSGGIRILHVTVDRVEVQLGDGGGWQSASVVRSGSQSLSWSFTGQVAASGPLRISARAVGHTSAGQGLTSTPPPITVTIADVVPPELTISAPGDTFPGDGRVSRVSVSVDAADSLSGITTIDWLLDSVGKVRESFAHPLPPRWSGTREVSILASATPSHSIVVRCTDGSGNVTDRSLIIYTPDRTPPFCEIIEPKDGTTIPGTDTGAMIALRGTAEDRQSGIQTVEWSLDGGQTYTAAQTSNGWRNWQAQITIPAPAYGRYALTVRFKDNAGQQSDKTVQLEVARPYTPQSAADLLSVRAYLEDLVRFGSHHIMTPAQSLTTQDLERVFHQPFAHLTDPLASWGGQPVNQTRICIEVLRKHLGLVAHWQFDESSGTLARDSSEYGNDATLVNGPAWTSGRGGGALRFDGSNYAQVANAPALEVGKDGADFSVAFWLYVTKPPTGKHRRIIYKGNSDTAPGERTFALFMNPTTNHVHYTISTTSSPNEYGYSTAQIQINTWTHVAYVKAGNQLQLYLNGVQDSVVTLQGQSVSNTSPLYFGNVNWQQDPNTFIGFDGALDDVRLYDRPLAAAEIFELYARGETTWVDDALPAGAIPAPPQETVVEPWTWVQANPAPVSGTQAHQSSLAAGAHQHYFERATQVLPVAKGDRLFAYVYLDATSPPTEVMLGWSDGTSWEHRAYWGVNSIDWGQDGTASRRYMGPLPLAGQWVRLEVPARLVDLERRVLDGMAFTLYGGRATWDRAGKTSVQVTPASPGLRQAAFQYRQTAYTALLNRIGTSYEELRLARGADEVTRKALAVRLGLNFDPVSPNPLDTLLLQPGQLTEAKLEELFGLADTHRVPWQPTPEPELLKWQLAHLRTVWAQEDHSEQPSAGAHAPIIDPDLIGVDDLRSPVSGNVAFDLWQARATWVEDRLRELRAHREAAATALAGFDRIVREAFGPVEPVGHWRFDAGSGTTASDASGNTNPGTLQGPTWTAGKIGAWALAFDGIDDDVQVGPAAQLVLSSAGTISAWIYPLGPGTPGTGGVIVSKESEYAVARFPDGTIRWAFANSDPGWHWQTTHCVASEQQWTHIAVVYANGRVDTYANGRLVHTYTGAGIIGDVNTHLNDFHIGGRQGAVQHFHGLIDDVRVYNQALSPGVLSALFTFGGTDLLTLANAQKQGHTIEPALQVLHLTPQSFSRLLRVRALAEPPGTVTEAEWEDVYGILLQVMKSQAYTTWRAEERQRQMTLSHDHFKRSAAAPPLPAWRATPGARRQWQDTLQARIDQEHALQQALEAAVQAVEETTLPLLRAALVAAIGVNEGVADAANWLTDQLLIDAKTGGTQQTTRCQQAIETLQNVFFSLRTGRFESDHPADAWDFTETDTEAQLDEEWAWMGTHAAWRAAMLLFHYPENTLFPSLRGERERTAQFAALLRAARAKPRLTPEDARGLAAGYLDGLRGSKIAHWRLDEDSGAPADQDSRPQAADSSGNRNDGTVFGATFTVADGRKGLGFDGLDNYVQINNAPILEVGKNGGDFSVAFWLYLRQGPTGKLRAIVHKGASSSERTFLLVLHPDSNQIHYRISTTAGWNEGGDSEGLVSINVWTHVAYVKARGSLALYINGTWDSHVVLTGTPISNAGPLYFGKAPWWYGLNGVLSDVQIYDEALSAAEVAALCAKYGSRLPAELEQPFVLTDALPEDALKKRQTLATSLLKPYVDTTQTPNRLKPETLAYLTEVFYFVPMQLALLLQKSGHYIAALDWFQTVYAYNLPEQRKLYYGLELEQNLVPTLSKSPHWLRESLQPHALAASRPNPYTRYTLLALVRCFLDFADAEFARDTSESVANARALYLTARRLLALPELELPPASALVLPNPVQETLALRAEMQLAKLRQGRNIAGMRRQLEPPTPALAVIALPGVDGAGRGAGTSPVDLRPTPYRYSVLIERSKQLVGLAQQMEAAYLAALEKRDAEHYNLKKAGYDLELAQAGVTLQGLRVTEAKGGKALADLQQQRVAIQQKTYQEWIDAGLNAWETTMMQNYRDARVARTGAAYLDAMAQMAGATNPATAPFLALAAMGRAMATAVATQAETSAQIASIQASHERRKQEWELQKSLADKDHAIAGQQIQMALDHIAVVEQEKTIANMQTTHATAMADFLARKFTSAELYEWMSDVLAGVYGYFLQQATAIARLAQQQLAFERQAAPPSFIQADYWEPPSETGMTSAADGNKTDRRGLTGSARLLQDIYQLDQYAFETDKRKLNLSQTFSLARLVPFEFQRFRETGVLPFATPMRLFDEAFPGHYLRLIKRVRTSVIALIPPTQGIRATLTTSGISRAVIHSAGMFQEMIIRRDPEMVALTSPINATGVFELDTQSDMLLPFESMGVDTSWEFQMLRAANPFDYRTIADVLLTIDYTSLHSFDYRQQVIKRLDQTISAERSYSFRHQFPDEWWALHNPMQPGQPMTIRVNTRREDFPPNIEALKIQHVLLYFACTAEDTFEIDVTALKFTPAGGPAAAGSARTIDGIISTRRGNGTSWAGMLDKPPAGTWELTLPASAQSLFTDEKIEDILLVITYSGHTPPWPV